MSSAALFLPTTAKLEASSRWGLLPFAVALGIFVTLRTATLSFGAESRGQRLLFGALATVAVTTLVVRAMGAAGLLTQDALFVALVGAAVVVSIPGRRALGVRWSDVTSRETAPVLAVAGVALSIALLAAYWLPIWQWDALGYHLPFVDFALQRGSLADVPRDVPYISTYPHAIELYFVAWRAMLPDDRLVDAAQIPLGLLGAGAIAGVARSAGARRDLALTAGAAWLMLPAVFLQLPTNYIDVGSAAFLLTAAAFLLVAPSPFTTVGAGIAIGLFLGSKPNAPVGACLLLLALGVRAWKARLPRSFALALALVVILGAESYLANLVRYGNPVWPVTVSFGPVQLPGTTPMQALLDSGAAAPRLHGSLPSRLVRSWLSLDAPPVFDMRYGGLGLVFLAALPFGVVEAYRRRSLALVCVIAASLASPDPVVARYILAFPGLVLALAAARLSRAGDLIRLSSTAAVAAASLFAIVRAYPGLSGDGPALFSYAGFDESRRLRAVGANGTPGPFYDALERLAPGDETIFDASFDLPYLAWPPDLSRRARRMPDRIDEAGVERILVDPHARLLIVDRSSAVAQRARSMDGRFSELFSCRTAPCVVFIRN